jgi:superfamily II DNA or RNA helicase
MQIPLSKETLGAYARFMAKCEANHILAKYSYDPVTVFATSKIQPLPYQLEDFLALVEMLRMERVRSLLAYETGLGKTIVAGLLIRELLSQDRDARVLILVPPMVINQWRTEMETKFDLIFKTYEETSDLSEQLLIASMDTLRNERRVSDIRDRGSKWSLVVVDELHKATPGNKRYKLIELLRDRTDHFLGLTATPHDGKVDHFVGRLQLINASVNESNFRHFVREYCFRRQKRDVTDLDGKKLFPYTVDVNTERVSVTPEEESFYDAVENYVRNQYRLAESNRRSPRGLIATIMGRMVSSSIRTGIEALKRRRERLLSGLSVSPSYLDELLTSLREAEDQEDEERKEEIYNEILSMTPAESKKEIEEEVQAIDRLVELGEKVHEDSKLKELVKTAKMHIMKGDKLIVFTSFIATAEYLYDKLKEEFGEKEVYIATGHIEPDPRRDSIRKFLESGKILIGTDVIGESLNLQEANVVYNYEMPWSPIPYIQRVGRVYRYPQKKPIFVHNFSSQLRVEQRVLEIVYRKVDNLVRDFDEGSVAVIGAEVTEQTIENTIKEAYARGIEPVEVDLSDRLERAAKNAEKIKEVLNISEAASRHVDVSSLLKDPTEVITTEDIRRFLEYAKEAGIGKGSVYSDFPSYYVQDIPVKKFSIEDKGVRHALNDALNLPIEKVAFVWDGQDLAGEVRVIEYLNGLGKPFQRDVVVATSKGIIPYKTLSSLRPTMWALPDDIKINVELNTDKYMLSRIKALEEKIKEQVVYKAKLINEQEDLVKKEGRDPAFTETYLDLLRQKKEELKKESEKVSVKGIGVIGYVRLRSQAALYSETRDEIYSPEAQRAKHAVEVAAMDFVMEYERQNGWTPEDVHDENRGYDIVSRREDKERYIEVKGLSYPNEDTVVLTYNEIKASEYFKDDYHLYVVFDPLQRQ